jgi:hypothetical protein
MPPTLQMTSRSSVHIGSLRSVVIGQGASRVTFSAPAIAQWSQPAGRLIVQAPPRSLVIGGRQGIAGPPGPGAEIEIYTAAVSIGGHRAVALDASGEIIYASSALNLSAIGIVRDAVTAGAEVAVYRAGRVAGFSGLTPGATYYLSAAGTLSLTPPASGVLQPLGIAASATEMLVDPDYPTFL